MSTQSTPIPLSPNVIGWAVAGAFIAAIFAAFQPIAGLALGVMALLVVLLRGVPLRRLGAVLAFAAAVAAVAGPNLGVPAAKEVFAFRILIVVLALGTAGYLLMGGTLSMPRSVAVPAGLLGIWVAWSIVSIGWSEDPVAAVRWTTFLAMMSALVIALALVCRTKERTRTLLWLLLGAFIVAVLVAAAEVLFGLRLATTRPGRETASLFGVSSLFGNQNNFATYLTLTLPYFAVLPLIYRDFRLRALGLIGTGIALMALLYTGSKSNLLATGIIFVALFLVLGADKRMRGRLVGAAVIAGLAAALVIPAIQGSGVVKLPERVVTKFDFSVFASQIETGAGSGALRSSLTAEGIDLIEDTKGRGVGAGNAETAVKSRNPDARVANLHNWWLEVTVNGGLIALVLFGLFYFRLLLRQIHHATHRTDRFVRYLTLAGAISLVGFFAGSLGPSSSIHFAPMWIVFALGVIAIGLARQEPT